MVSIQNIKIQIKQLEHQNQGIDLAWYLASLHPDVKDQIFDHDGNPLW